MSYKAAYLQAAFFVIASAIALAALRFWPSAGSLPVAAFFPPGWSAERSFAAASTAGAAIVSPGGWANVVVVSADPDARAALRRAGAFLFLDAEALAACDGRARSFQPPGA